MFMVHWEGSPPADRAEWIAAMKPVFQGAAGAYHVNFQRGKAGWRFDLEWRADSSLSDSLIANGPDGIRYNLYRALVDQGKALDPHWER